MVASESYKKTNITQKDYLAIDTQPTLPIIIATPSRHISNL